MAAASRKRALIPYFFSASTKAAPSLGSGVAAFRYSSIAQADTPLIDRRFVSRVMGRPAWYGLARGTRASTEGDDDTHHEHGGEHGQRDAEARERDHWITTCG